MRKAIAFSILIAVDVFLGNQSAFSQGCVAVRPMSCASTGNGYINTVGINQQGQWRVSSAYRYFRSFRHFRGDHEEAFRVENGTEVINITHAADLGISYQLSNRVALNLNAPLIYYNRSSLYEHYGNSITSNPAQARFDTGSQGLGDIRLGASYWIFDPARSLKGNVSVGLGIKAPTGNENVQDTFHRLATDGSDSLITKAVDQSIQLGDGGWGINLEMQGYRSLFKNGALYFNAFYLLNPREMNTVPYSVADQYAARLGLNYAVLPKTGISAGMGGRLEGIPSEDLIGGSEGRRRPGYIISIEPSISYNRNAVNLTLNFPIALYRNRTQSVSDKQRTRETGQYRIGDAAFADYLINVNFSYSFGGKHGHMSMPAKIEMPNLSEKK